MTEDDTYRKLKQAPFAEVAAVVDANYGLSRKDKKQLLKSFNWEWTEFYKTYNKYANEKLWQEEQQ